MIRSLQTNKASLLGISFIAVVFGLWFAHQQVLAVAADAFASYPKFYFAVTTLKCVFTILTLFSLSCLLIQYFSKQKVSIKQVAASYLPLCLVLVHCPLLAIVGLIVAIQLLCLFSSWQRQDYVWLFKNYSTNFAAFAVLLALHFMFTAEFSPLHWKDALYTTPSEEIPVQAPIYKGYALAKQFAFSTMDYSEWAGALNPPITLASPFSQMLTLTLDLPSINPVDFHVLLDAINFILVVAGSFGCFLFLRYAAKIHPIYAFIGGCLMFFSTAPFQVLMQQSDGGVFITPYAIFPFCLLFLSLACEKNSYVFASWAGIALASQFFFYTPHPEGVIYSGLFLGIYAIGLILFSPYTNWPKRFALTSVAFMLFLTLSAYVVVPIFMDQIQGNIHTFAHMDLEVANIDGLNKYKWMYYAFIPLSLILLLKNKKSYPVYLPALFLSLFLLGFFVATNHLKFVEMVINTLHVGLHLWDPWRIGPYVCLSIFFIALMCLNAITPRLVNFFIFLSTEYKNELN